MKCKKVSPKGKSGQKGIKLLACALQGKRTLSRQNSPVRFIQENLINRNIRLNWRRLFVDIVCGLW